MSTLTIQPSNIDTYLDQAGANFGSGAGLKVWCYTNYINRSILKFDFSALPAGAIISAATLSLYYLRWDYGDPVGRTYWAYELTQTGWVELEATWIIYRTGNNWGTAGGDYVTGNGASVAMPASTGQWVNWNVLALVQHFQSAHANVAHFLIRDGTENVSPAFDAMFHSNNYTTNPALCPKLVITYTGGGLSIPVAMRTYRNLRS